MKNIKLLTSVFKTAGDIENDIIIPVSAGTALYPDDIETSFRDDTGDNISLKNPDYCELTVQYWAWKNLDCDFYGLMHRRRFFDFDLSKAYTAECPKIRRPYKIFDSPNQKTLNKIHADRSSIEKITDKFKVIAPLRENIYRSVRDYYNLSDRGEFDDLGLVCDIIEGLYPEYSEYANTYLDGNYSYFCNMFIMDKKHFCEYSDWLFGVLSEYELRKPAKYRYPRECGKIAERLFGIWFFKLIADGKTSWAELPRAHFRSVGGTTEKNLSFNRAVYTFFPPGTKRKAWLWGLKRS